MPRSIQVAPGLIFQPKSLLIDPGSRIFYWASVWILISFLPSNASQEVPPVWRSKWTKNDSHYAQRNHTDSHHTWVSCVTRAPCRTSHGDSDFPGGSFLPPTKSEAEVTLPSILTISKDDFEGTSLVFRWTEGRRDCPFP